ncbi:hypothetical protein KTH46_07570 [Acinetobacter bereziniae]|uniref:DUF6387 family protein n=1 Tax=Acinetobacter bereziniae TaxID=106648 RepID=UPI0021D3E860|nr:DUF6387 family protein [Acinetobacter bereziniae]MCU4314883.1 hypothetical protein [Acinetobacter bereziniae]
MSKLIRTTDDLPKDFNLDKYNDLDKKSAIFWHHALQKRIILHYYMVYAVEDFSLSLGFHDRSDDSQLTEKEVYNIKKIAILNNLKDPCSNELKFDFKRECGKVVEIDIYNDGNLSYLKKHLPVSTFTIEKIKFINLITEKYINNKNFEDANGELCIQDFLTNNLKFWLSPTEYPICINPFYPDNVIFDELKIKLDEIRQKIKIDNRKPLERKDLVYWSSYRLLSFFDLKLWEIFNDYKITRSVMAVTLYPKGQYGEDTIRKSVEPLYDEFLEGDTFDSSGFEQIDSNKRLSISDGLIRLAYAETGKNIT